MEKRAISLIIIGLICLMVLPCIPKVSGGEYPDFPKNKMIIIGHYSTVDEQESTGNSRDLHITCEKGDIVIIGGFWAKSGYSSWVYVRFIRDKYTHLHAPEFYGICRDGKIFGISYGEIYFY